MSDFFDEIEDPFGTLGSRLVNLGNYRNKKKSNFPIKDRYLGKVIKYHREYPIKNHFMYEEFSKHNDPSEVSPSYKIVVKELDDHKYFGSFSDLGPQNISLLTGDISQYDEFVINPKMNFSHNQTLAFFPGDLVYVSYALKEQRMGPYIVDLAGDYVPNIDLTGLSGEEIQELTPELVMVAESLSCLLLTAFIPRSINLFTPEDFHFKPELGCRTNLIIWKKKIIWFILKKKSYQIYCRY